MTIQEAIQSGKPFQRDPETSGRYWWNFILPDDGKIYSTHKDSAGNIRPTTFYADDILATDWETKD